MQNKQKARNIFRLMKNLAQRNKNRAKDVAVGPLFKPQYR